MREWTAGAVQAFPQGDRQAVFGVFWPSRRPGLGSAQDATMGMLGWMCSPGIGPAQDATMGGTCMP